LLIVKFVALLTEGRIVKDMETSTLAEDTAGLSAFLSG